MPFALITRLLTGEAGIFLARLRTMVVSYAIMGVFALITAIFLMVALFVWVSGHLGALVTALIFAAIFLFLTLVTFLAARTAGRRPPDTRRENRLQRDIASIAGVTAMANAPQVLRLLRQKRGLFIIPAVAAGFFGLYKTIAALRER